MDNPNDEPSPPELRLFYLLGEERFKYEARLFPGTKKERTETLDYSPKPAAVILKRAALLSKFLWEKPKLTEAEERSLEEGLEP